MNKRYQQILCVCAVLAACAAVVTAANQFTAPQSVLHIVTVQWKPDSTPGAAPGRR